MPRHHLRRGGPGAAIAATAAPSLAEARAQGRLILVAEDNPINQKVILRQLEVLGYAAEVASNGVEALQLWRTGHYGLLLTDLHMPDMDGYALAEAMRREEIQRGTTREWRIPILALTANALQGEALRARLAGMDEYLTKPLQLHLLNAALMKWLPRDRADSMFTELPGDAPPPAESRQPVDVGVLQALVGDDPATLREFLFDFQAAARRSAVELRAAAADRRPAPHQRARAPAQVVVAHGRRAAAGRPLRRAGERLPRRHARRPRAGPRALRRRAGDRRPADRRLPRGRLIARPDGVVSAPRSTAARRRARCAGRRGPARPPATGRPAPAPPAADGPPARRCDGFRTDRGHSTPRSEGSQRKSG